LRAFAKDRYHRSYSPEGLMVLRGPKEDFKPGSHWVVGDKQGYAELRFMENNRGYYGNSLYIENLVIKEPIRRMGYGRELYQKVEAFARNIKVRYIQLDSEKDVVGFWQKMGFKNIDIVYFHEKIAMIKEI
jgi:ribosomal protein S18 acetylase RimI-like enzyme